MSFNGSGSYTPPGASFPAVASTLIESAKYNNVINDMSTALSTCLTKDGQTTVTANLPMATYRHTGVGNATSLTDYASADQVIDNALSYAGASAAGTDTYAVTLTISPGAYAVGQKYQFLTDVVNTGACTVNFNSIGAKSIKFADGSDPYNGAIQASSVVDVIYDGTNFILLNPHLDSLAYGRSILDISSEANFKALVNLEIGTDVQAYDANIVTLPGGGATKMVFYQASAPTGWTQVVTDNDKALRVVSGSGGGSGGTHGLSTPPSTAHTHTGPSHTHGYSTVIAHTHTFTTASDGSHAHTINVWGGSGTYNALGGDGSTLSRTENTSSTGSHTHTGTTASTGSGSGTTTAAGTGNTGSNGPTAFAPQYIDVIVCSKD